jgi:hypothetical protein
MATSLKDILLGENPNFPNGSSLSYGNGADIATNPQAIIGNATSIHSNNGDAELSYSLNGDDDDTAEDIFNSYNLGSVNVSNPVPEPSELDRNDGYTPSRYANNKPAGSQSFPSFS